MSKFKIKFIRWFHSLFPGKYCWADCVSWAYSKRWNPFKIDKGTACQIGSNDGFHKTCYCGQFYKGKCWAKMTAQEQQEARGSEKELSNPPF